MSTSKYDDIILDVRDKIGYVIPIVLLSIVTIIGFTSIQIYYEITSENFQITNIVFFSIIILFSSTLIIPLKILFTIFKKTKILGQKIFVNDMFEGLLKIDYLNKNMNEKIFEVITKGMPQFSNVKYAGKQKIKNYEFDVLQNSPAAPFPQLWKTREIVFAKYFSIKTVSESDLKEMYEVIKKSKLYKSKSVKIFLIGDDFEPIFNDNKNIQKIMAQWNIFHYLTILKNTESGFEVLFIENKDRVV